MKIIAEIAQGFEGSLTQAKLLLKAASSSGADIAKLQLVYADELATQDYIYYKLFKNLEMSFKQWKELHEYSKELKIELDLDIFGKKSLKLAEKLCIDGVKLHGTDITNIGLLKLVSKSKIKKIYLGAGGSNLDEIEHAISILKNKKIILLLGFQSYPTPDCDNQISRITYLKKRFNNKKIEIGFADHANSNSSLSITLAAAALGAGSTVIEKHLTLGKVMKLEDYESALNPDEFSNFTKTIKLCFKALGSTSKSNDFDMSKSEKVYRKMIRRHVTSSRDIKKGTVISAEDLVLKRTSSKNYISDINKVINKIITKDITKDSAIIKDFLK
tara:strand:+ start:68 stop:1057 length:990 start_codon:yes stop_codon:yes gene_type:complete